MNKVIGIAGGSGAGKSTISYELVDSNPEVFQVINLDDYQKLKTDPDLPRIDGMINWDHPDIIRWDDLLADIERLREGKSVTIQVWSHRSNPDYAKHHKMIPRTIFPKPILLVEGYLALHDETLRSQYGRSYFLNLDDETRARRRRKNNLVTDSDYEEKVLKPMYKKYVEPTQKYADVVLNVSNMSVDDVVSRIKTEISE